MQSEAESFCHFMEVDLKIITDIQRDTKMLLMPPKKREALCYESYFNYLDNLYLAGEQDQVISIIAKVMINIPRDSKPVRVLPGYGKGYGHNYSSGRNNEISKNKNNEE